MLLREIHTRVKKLKKSRKMRQLGNSSGTLCTSLALPRVCKLPRSLHQTVRSVLGAGSERDHWHNGKSSACMRWQCTDKVQNRSWICSKLFETFPAALLDANCMMLRRRVGGVPAQACVQTWKQHWCSGQGCVATTCCQHIVKVSYMMT